MESPITRAEHEEFKKRLEEENHRLSKRITTVEDKLDKYTDLALSVKSLALSMENMAKEQEKQGQRLDDLEQKPAENWNAIIRSILTGIGSAIAVALVALIASGAVK